LAILAIKQAEKKIETIIVASSFRGKTFTRYEGLCLIWKGRILDHIRTNFKLMAFKTGWTDSEDLQNVGRQV